MSATDHLTFNVENLGAFQARLRTLGSQIQIERQYGQELGGSEESAPESLRVLAAIKAQLGALLTSVPEGFNLDEAMLSDVYAIYAALRSAEDRFLDELAQKRQGTRQAA